MARTYKAKALESSDLMLLALYVLIPLSIGLEIWSLQIATSATTNPCKNVMYPEDDVTLRFENFKTVKTYSKD